MDQLVAGRRMHAVSSPANRQTRCCYWLLPILLLLLFLSSASSMMCARIPDFRTYVRTSVRTATYICAGPFGSISSLTGRRGIERARASSEICCNLSSWSGGSGQEFSCQEGVSWLRRLLFLSKWEKKMLRKYDFFFAIGIAVVVAVNCCWQW